MYDGDGAGGDRVVDAALKKGAMSLIGVYIGMGGKGWASSSTRTGPRENSEYRGGGPGRVGDDEAYGCRWLLAWEAWSLWGLSARVLAWLLRQGRSR